MTAADLLLVLTFAGLTAYALFGGADFGAGFWDLIGGGGEDETAQRGLIEEVIGPVWEADHVWLIFAIVVVWTAFPPVFAAVASTLYIPLTLAGLGSSCGVPDMPSARPPTDNAGKGSTDGSSACHRSCPRSSSGRSPVPLRPDACRPETPPVTSWAAGEPIITPGWHPRGRTLRVPRGCLPDRGRPAPASRCDSGSIPATRGRRLAWSSGPSQ